VSAKGYIRSVAILLLLLAASFGTGFFAGVRGSNTEVAELKTTVSSIRSSVGILGNSLQRAREGYNELVELKQRDEESIRELAAENNQLKAENQRIRELADNQGSVIKRIRERNIESGSRSRELTVGIGAAVEEIDRIIEKYSEESSD
jgi:methyl-accepting chemotaxis protein